MSRSFAAFLLLAFATALCAQDAAVPPLEGTVIHRLGRTNWGVRAGNVSDGLA